MHPSDTVCQLSSPTSPRDGRPASFVGDGRQHELLLEESLAGRRNVSADMQGFAELLQALRDANHPSHDEACEWLGDFVSESLAVHIRVGLARRFSELAIFDARLYIRIRRIDEPIELCGVGGRPRSQLHMAHELSGALQQAPRIPQPRAVKEPHVYVGSE